MYYCIISLLALHLSLIICIQHATRGAGIVHYYGPCDPSLRPKIDIVFDICFTVFGTALTTILPILFQYCYKYCYSDIWNL
jgi:hypothetical protein